MSAPTIHANPSSPTPVETRTARLTGGALYAVDAVLTGGTPGLPGWISDVLVVPASVGELWMRGYLIVLGIRPQATGRDGAGNASVARS